ncbi:hypothetical protein LJC34_04300 [Oscillospiraceae bacterium OttesenSCG-928-G22]|nr:hypothetical protein [Oscillospiraceae bacterium OttesenSCG-928-G22]
MKFGRAVAVLLLGMLFGGFLVFAIVQGGVLQRAEATAGPSESPPASKIVIDEAYRVVRLIRNEDYPALSEAIHPEKGVVFVPYSYVEPDGAHVFTPAQVKGFATDKNTYLWGSYDGSGEPIQFTPAEYFAMFVYNADYENAPVVTVNTVARSGNAIENVAEAFPEAQFVDFHFPELEKKYEGLDWCSLRLVFEEFGGKPCLVAVIHSQWTI